MYINCNHIYGKQVLIFLEEHHHALEVGGRRQHVILSCLIAVMYFDEISKLWCCSDITIRDWYSRTLK